MANLNDIYDELRNRGLRVTKQRKEMLEILSGQHLSLKDLHDELVKKGYVNLSTVYNNLFELMSHGVVQEVYIDKTKYYELVTDGIYFNSQDHIHVSCKNNQNILEIEDEEIMNFIKKSKYFANFEVDKIELHVKGSCRHESKDCDKQGMVCGSKTYIKKSSR